MFTTVLRAIARMSVAIATVVAASAVTAAGSGTAHAAPSVGTTAFDPSSGNSDTVISLTPSEFPAASGGAFCSGPGTSSYRWQTFIVDAGVDASTLTFGTGPNPVAGHFVSRLYDSGGSSVSNKNPTSTGQITGIPSFSFAVFTGPIALASGEYKVGFACTLSGVIENGRYWQTTITIATDVTNGGTAQIDYVVGNKPAAPVLAAPLVVGDTTLDGVFTSTSADPQITGFTVTAHPSSGPDVTLPVAAGANSFHLTGLVNDTHYAVTVTATNAAGNSAPSNTVNGTPGAVPQPPVVTSPLIAGSQFLDGTFSSTPASPPITGFTVAAHPPSGSDVTLSLGAAATSFHLVGLTNGTQYAVTVKSINSIGNSPASNSVNGTPGTAPAAPVLASPLQPGNTTLDGTFTATPAAPGITGFTVTAVPTAGTIVTLPLAANATSFHLIGLVNDTQYAVTVVASNSFGDSPASNSVNGTPGLVPDAPVLASPLTAGNQTLDGSFTSTPSTPAIAGFVVNAHPPVGSDVTLSLGATATTFHLTGLTNGTIYGVTVKATNSVGNGPASNSVTGTPGTAPAAPTLASPLASGNQSLDGTFTPGAAAPVATGFTISAVPTAGATVTLSLAAGVTSFHLAGLTNTVEYAVTVKAANAFGDSPASNEVKGTPGQVPVAPVLASPLAAGNQTIDGTFLQVTSNPPTTGYTVTAAPASGPTVTLNRPAGSTSFHLTGLANGIRYAVTVKATNDIGNSAPSNAVSATPGTVPNAPAIAPTLIAGDKSLSGTFTRETSVPATVGFTVVAVPASGPTVAMTRPPSATTFQLVGLVNGVQYTVTVKATNVFGDSAASNAVSGTPGLVPAAPVLAPALTAGNHSLHGTFTALASSPATTGYTAKATPATGDEVTEALAAGTTSFHLTGLVNGVQYSVTVIATNVIGHSVASNELEGTPVASGLVAFAPGRVLDTRSGGTTVDGQSAGIGLRDADSVTEVEIVGRAGVPGDGDAVVLNVTVTEPQGDGYVTVFPCGSPRPTASNLNYTVGATVPNTVLSKLGSGKVCLYTQAAAHLIVDVNGYFPHGTSYSAVNPARVLETRAGQPSIDGEGSGAGLRPAGSVTELQITGRAGIPTDAAAAVLNVTVTEAEAAGYITVFPCGSEQPNASSVNYVAGATVANAVIIKIGAGGKVCLYTQSAAQLIADVNGYFPNDGSFTPLAPARVLDSRAGQSTVDGASAALGVLGAGSVTELQITGRAGVPANASAIVLNVTVTGPEAAGFLTVFPCGNERPNSSNLNYTPNATVANAAIAKIGAGGKVCFYSQASTDLVIDVNGYLVTS